MTKSTLCALALLAYLGASGAASASAGGSARTGPITIILTDLDPDDGIAPSISFSLAIPLGGLTHYPRASFRMLDGETYQYDDLFAEGVEPLMLSWAVGQRITGEVAVTGRESFATHLISAESHVGGAARLWSDAGGESGWYDFVLSPNTALVIEVTASVDGSINPTEGQFAAFSANASLGMWIGPAGDYDNQTSYGQWRRFTLDSSTGTATELSVLHPLRVAYENRSTSPAYGFVELSAGTSSSVGPLPTIPAIPEPGTLPMFAAGLGLIAAWSGVGLRRRTAGSG